MKMKLLLYISSAIIVVSNLMMATTMNHGEEVLSNFFVIGITVLLFPGFLWALNNEKASAIRAESAGLVMLAVISLLRFINRISALPSSVNAIAVFLAFVLGSVLIAVAAVRIFKKR